MDGRLMRAVFVLKARGTGHATELHQFLIDDRGAHVGERFKELRGVLTGIPQTVRVGARRASAQTRRVR